MAERILPQTFESFLGLDLKSSGLTRDRNSAMTFENVEKLRTNSVRGVRGFQSAAARNDKIQYGLHNYVYTSNPVVKTQSKICGTAADGGGGNPWTNPGNATASDGARATRAAAATPETSNYLNCSNFGFTIPSTAVVLGVGVSVEMQGTYTVGAAYAFAGLTINGTTYSTIETVVREEAVADTWLDFNSVTRYGSTTSLEAIDASTNKFGLTITAANVNTPTFGCRVKLRQLAAGNTQAIDAVQLTVYYLDEAVTTKEEMLGFGDGLYRKKNGSFTIGYTGAGTPTFSWLINESTNQWHVTLTDVTNILDSDEGIGFTTGTTLSTLSETIDVLANFSCTITPYAKVNGIQVGVTTITVDAGHTYVAGDRVELLDGGVVTWRNVLATTATTITISGPVVTVGNNEVFGPARLYAGAYLPLQDALDVSAASTTITFEYWEKVPCVQQGDTDPFVSHSENQNPFVSTDWVGQVKQHNFSAANMRDICLIATPFYSGFPFEGQATGLWKYDGVNLSWAGLPKPTTPSVVAAAGANLIAGNVYKYMTVYQYIDAKGNITESIPSEIVSYTPGVNGSAVVTTPGIPRGSFGAAWNTGYVTVNGTQTNVNTITVNAPILFVKGSVVSFYDNKRGEYTDRTVTGITATTITVSGSPVNVTNSDGISAGLRIFLYRTIANGNEFRLVSKDESSSLSSQTVSDTLTDAQLGESYVEPSPLPYLFPKISIITEHQGLLMASGNPEEPVNIYPSSAESPEYCNLADGTFSVPNTVAGDIRAMRSDTDDRFVVFKDYAAYDVIGGIADYAFTINTIGEYDIGCSSHHAIARVGGQLVFPFNSGFHIISNGRVVGDFNDNLATVFKSNYYEAAQGVAIPTANQNKLVLKRALAVNDSENQQAIFFIPAETGTFGDASTVEANSNSKIYVWSYLTNTWASWSFPNYTTYPAGGMVIHRNNLYFLSRYTSGGLLYGQTYRRHQVESRYSYAMHNVAIPQDVWMQWEHLGDPSIYKQLLRLKLWNMQPTEFVPFAVRVRIYKDFYSTTPKTDNTLTFTSSAQFEQELKSISDKMRAWAIRLTCSTIHQAMLITGLETVVALDYAKDDF